MFRYHVNYETFHKNIAEQCSNAIFKYENYYDIYRGTKN